MLRKLEDSDIVGKTVASIYQTSVNVVKLTFTDGTTLELWGELVPIGSRDHVGGIFVEDHS